MERVRKPKEDLPPEEGLLPREQPHFLATFTLWYNSWQWKIDSAKFVGVSRKAADRVRFGKPHGTIRNRTRRPALEEFVKACKVERFRVTPATVHELLTLAGEWRMRGLEEVCRQFMKQRDIQYPPQDPFDVLEQRTGLPLLDQGMLEDPRIFQLAPEDFYTLLIEADSPRESDMPDPIEDPDTHAPSFDPALLGAVVFKKLECQGEEAEAAVPLILETELNEEDLDTAFEMQEVHRENLNYFIAWSASHLRVKSEALNRHLQRKVLCRLLGLQALLQDRELNDLLKEQHDANATLAAMERTVAEQAAEIERLSGAIEAAKKAYDVSSAKRDADLAAAEAELAGMLARVQEAVDLDKPEQVTRSVATEVEKVEGQLTTRLGAAGKALQDLDETVTDVEQRMKGAQALVLTKFAKSVVDRQRLIRDKKNWHGAFTAGVLGVTEKDAQAAAKTLKGLEKAIEARCPYT